MAFEKFKAKHGGEGPFQLVSDALTDGQGFFGIRGIHKERSLTDKLIAQVQGDEELAGLSALATQGSAPMTREQHVQFRAGLQQAVLNQHAFDKDYAGFQTSNADLQSGAITEESRKLLDLVAQQGEIANRDIHSGDPTVRQMGQVRMTSLLDQQQAFQSAQVATRNQFDLATQNDRFKTRDKYQTMLISQVIQPLSEETAHYANVLNQLTTGKPDELVPNPILSAALEYTTGGSLRTADDGSISFRLGPVGINDSNLPQMTYSQANNLVKRAHQGYASQLIAQGDQIAQLAKADGFTVNAGGVDDVIYPLANAARKQLELEKEIKPPSIFAPMAGGSQGLQDAGAAARAKGEQAAGMAGDFAQGFLGFDTRRLFNVTRGGEGAKADIVSVRPPRQRPQQLPVRGIIQRPTND